MQFVCIASTLSGYMTSYGTHYNDVIMSAMASQITGLTIVYPSVYSQIQRNYQIPASLAFVRGIHRWPVNFPHKEPVIWKMFPFNDVIITRNERVNCSHIIDRNVCLLPRVVLICNLSNQNHVLVDISEGNISRFSYVMSVNIVVKMRARQK